MRFFKTFMRADNLVYSWRAPVPQSLTIRHHRDPSANTTPITIQETKGNYETSSPSGTAINEQESLYTCIGLINAFNSLNSNSIARHDTWQATSTKNWPQNQQKHT